jgi:Phage protein Gp138 N-terminal domain
MTDKTRESVPSTEQSLIETVSSMLKEVHTCLPGIISSFNSDSQTVEAQPTIQRVFKESGAVNLPLCVDIPVVFPGGGDFFLTFPVKPGDHCLLIFSERCIDKWALDGEIGPPEDFRSHDLSDAFAFVGVNPVSSALPSFNNGSAELRNRSGSTKLELGDDGFKLTGKLVVTGDIETTGSVKNNGKEIGSPHIHDGVQSGIGTSGGVV